MPTSFRRVAVIGTGLIGGSLALAWRKHFPDSVVVGWDKPAVLRHAMELGAIHEALPDLTQALSGADLIFVALPVGHTIELLPEIARLAALGALVTDAASTKRSVCATAAESFHEGSAHFLGGHPMAGKEISGIAAAEASLFRGSKYALIRPSAREKLNKDREARVAQFVAAIEQLAAEPVWIDADAHDRAAAVVSHLPQLLSVAGAMLARKRKPGRGLRTYRAKSFAVTSRRPHRITADAEPAGTTPARFEIAPHALRIFVP